jgi:hypothetical protein
MSVLIVSTFSFYLRVLMKYSTSVCYKECGLDDQGIRVRFPTGIEIFPLRLRDQTGSEERPFFCPIGIGALSPRLKRPRRKAEHSNSVMKSSVFWGITPCSPLKNELTFRRNVSPPSSGSVAFKLVSLRGLFFDPDDVGDMLLRNVGWLSNGLHGVIIQKTELFITTAGRTSHPIT